MTNPIVNIFFLLTFLLSSFPLSAQVWNWVSQSQGPSTEIGRGAINDSYGNLYYTGIFEDQVNFDGDTLISAGSADVFVCKYSPNGTRQWLQSLGGINLDRVMDIGIDAQSNIYLIGGFSDWLVIGPDSLWSANRDLFIAKYDSSGQALWGRAIGGNKSDFGQSIAVDKRGNIFLTGTFFSDSLSFGSQTLYTQGRGDLLIAKLDPMGNPCWAQQAGTSAFAIGNAIQTDGRDRIYVTGSFQGNASFDGNNLQAQSGADMFIAQYDTAGVLQWVRHGAGAGVESGQALYLSPTRYLYMAGRFSASLSLDSALMTSQGSYDFVLAKYDSTGHMIWAKAAGGLGADQAWNLDGDRLGNVYMIGDYSDQFNCGNSTLSSAGNSDIFLAKYDVTGKPLWVQSAGSMESDQGYALCTNKSGEIYLTGHFRDSATFDNTQLYSAGYEDAFLANIRDLDSTYIPDRPYNLVKGQVFHDDDQDCVVSPPDRLVERWIMEATPGGYYGLTDKAGAYQLATDSGTFAVQPLIPSDLDFMATPLCPLGPGSLKVRFDTLAQTAVSQDFAIDVDVCPMLAVSVSSTQRVRCQRSHTSIRYSNRGISPANNAVIDLYLPANTFLLQADMPFTTLGNGHIQFQVGTVHPMEYREIQVIDSVDCSTPLMVGANLSTRVSISPTNTCRPIDPAWIQTSLAVEGICLGNDTVEFRVKNVGKNHMQDSVAYQIYFGDSLGYAAQLRLDAGDSLRLWVAAQGQTLRLETAQILAHPDERWLSKTVEACNGPIHPTVYRHFPSADDYRLDRDQQDLALDVTPLPVTLRALPEGRGAMHLIRPETRIHYQFIYQHTGTDTLQTLTVVDTLSAAHDLRTLRWEAASHPYELDVTGKGQAVIKWTFDHIKLAPQAFLSLQFSIKPQAGLPNGTSLSNRFWMWKEVRPATPTLVYTHTIGAENLVKWQASRVTDCTNGPSVAMAGLDHFLCGADSVQLNAMAPQRGQGSWSILNGAAHIDSIHLATSWASGLPFGQTILTWRTHLCDLSSTDQVLIQRDSIPATPVIMPQGPLTICEGDSVLLFSAQHYSHYQWSNGSTQFQTWVTQADTITLQGFSAAGCVSQPATPVVVALSPNPGTPSIVQRGDTLSASAAAHYQWFDRHGAITGANQQDWQPPKNGTYYVVVTNGDGCSATSDGFFFELLNSSIASELAAEIGLQVYPNPSQGLFTLSLQTSGKPKTGFGIYTLLGQPIRPRELIEGKTVTLDLRDQPSGIYVLIVEQGDRQAIVKLVKR